MVTSMQKVFTLVEEEWCERDTFVDCCYKDIDDETIAFAERCLFSMLL